MEHLRKAEGRRNWRASPVSSSTMLQAASPHTGEALDSLSNVHRDNRVMSFAFFSRSPRQPLFKESSPRVAGL